MCRDNYTCPPVPLPLLVPVLLATLLLALRGPLLILSPALLLVTALRVVPLLLASLPLLLVKKTLLSDRDDEVIV